MSELAAGLIVVLAMSAIYAFILRGSTKEKGRSRWILEKIGGKHEGPEFVTGLLATFALATLTLHVGPAESVVAGGLMAFLAAACMLLPMIRTPVHFLYSVLGVLGAIDAARRYLFPPHSEPGEHWLRWALLALVWTFAVFGAMAGFAAGHVRWKLGLLLYAGTEILICAAELLHASRMINVWVIIIILVGALAFGVASARWETVVESGAALGMTLGTVALFGVASEVPGAGGFLQATGSTMALIITFLLAFAALHATRRRTAKLLPF
jgi:hypothetical protein